MIDIPRRRGVSLRPMADTANLNHLLAWLDSDLIHARGKYEDVRKRLIKYFICRGCDNPEELADKTINRVNQKIDELVKYYAGDQIAYFYAIARNVYREYILGRDSGHS